MFEFTTWVERLSDTMHTFKTDPKRSYGSVESRALGDETQCVTTSGFFLLFHT